MREGTRRGLKRHADAPQQGDEGAPIRREVGIGMRLPADHDEIAGEVAEQDVVLDLRVLCGTGHAEAHVQVRGSVERVPCGLKVGLCLCFVQCFCMNSGGVLFVARPRFVFLLGLFDAPLPLLVAFTPAFI